MIGWYCNAGYYEGAIGDFKNISQCKFLDVHRPFVIPVLKEMPPESVLNNGFIGSNNLEEAFGIITKYFGHDWYLLSLAMFSTSAVRKNNLYYAEYQEKLKAFMPGYNVAWPNTLEFFASESNIGNKYGVIYIPALKRVIRYENNGYRAWLCKVDEDGNISLLTAPGDYSFYYNSEYGSADYYNGKFDWLSLCNCVFAIKPSFSDYSDLQKLNTFVVLETYNTRTKGTYNPYAYCVGDWYETTKVASIYLKLFSDFSEPEFSGDNIPPDNPYDPGGPSKPGDTPPGTFDDTSNPIPDSSLPVISAANTGFTRIYNPTLAQVQDLARYLWTDETVIQTIWNHIKQYFEDPMQAIIGFNLVPVKVPDGGSKNFALMYIDTGVAMNTAANQFVDVDCGTLELKRFYGSALDQSPFTKVSCFLPYIGTVQLNCDEVMGTTLQVKYRVDIVSGSCVAKILVDGNVLYQYSGHCAINIPISSADFSSYVASAISVAKLAIGATVGGVAGALSAVPEPAPQTNQTETVERTTARNIETGRQVITGTKTTTITETKSPKQTSTKASYSFLSPANIANTVGQVMSSKPVIQHSGSFSGNTGYLGIRRPFLIVERPNMCMPEQYQHFNGYPAMITLTLSDCKGFTRIQQVQLTGMSATNPEQAEIMGLLKSGVYL